MSMTAIGKEDGPRRLRLSAKSRRGADHAFFFVPIRNTCPHNPFACPCVPLTSASPLPNILLSRIVSRRTSEVETPAAH